MCLLCHNVIVSVAAGAQAADCHADSKSDKSAMSLFSGTWRLVYSSAFASGSLGGFRPGPQAALVPVTIGQVGTPPMHQHVLMLSNDGLEAHVRDSIALPNCSRHSASWQGYEGSSWPQLVCLEQGAPLARISCGSTAVAGVSDSLYCYCRSKESHSFPGHHGALWPGLTNCEM